MGAQIHGSYSWDESRSVGYSLYVVNGLEQADADPSDGVIDDGGAIRSMRQNNEEVNNANKAIGGRLGAEPIPGVKAGVSGYTGAYTVDGKQRLSIANVDLGVHKRRATLEAEITIAMQQTRRRDLTKLGYYVLIGYRVLDWFEPVAQYDAIDLDGAATDDRRRMTGGLVIYPFPKKIGTAVLKSSFASTTDARGDSSWRAVGQVAVGF